MRVSFVIPSWNHFELINQLLCDVRDNCTPDEIIVVDDCSTDQKAIDGLAWWAENYGVTVLRTPENQGFLRTSNFGLKQATGDIVCLISTDVRIYKDLCPIVSAMMTVNPKLLLGGRYLDFDTGWNTFEGKIYKYIEGWLLITTKENWEELGYFDERYIPCDMEDICLSTTALSKGFDIAAISAVNGLLVEHIGAQSIGYTEERRKITERNKKLFEEKWMK